jgi:TonB family protein
MATRRRADHLIGNGFEPPRLNALGAKHYGTVCSWLIMADTKALFTQRFDAARTALTKGDELAAAESFHSAIVVARSDPSLRRELASSLFHLGRLSRKFGRAGEAEAENLLTEALTVSEGLVGKEHAALAPLLNELGRLYVQRARYARADDVFKRLLAITRGAGDENADVATALAALAGVKRKLGDDTAAEALYRDALRIREKVLEPNHMVTVVTLEQLSQTCAARGNFAEALALLRRGLATREVVLGPGHATVQAARSRMAELELQVAVAADTAAVAATKAARGTIETPVWFKRVPDSPIDTPSTTGQSPISSKTLEFPSEPKSQAPRPAALSRERAKTPAVTAAVAAASLMASSIPTPSASQIVVSPPASVIARTSDVARRDPVLANVAQSDVASDDAALGERQSTIAPIHADVPAPARKKRTKLYAFAGVAAVAIVGFLMLRPHVGGGGDPVPPKMNAAQRTTAGVAPVAPVATAPATAIGSTAIGAAAVTGAARTDSVVSAGANPAPTAPVVQPGTRAPESAPVNVPRIDVQLGPIDLPSVPDPSIVASRSIDSMARSAAERRRASDSDRAVERVAAPASVDVENAVTPAKLVGRMPEPRFPEALLRSGRREGEVVVRFIVNEAGKVDVASMIVERSDDELFTAAVRDILPRFRFEPARTHAPESKPIAGWVSVPFRFTTKK